MKNDRDLAINLINDKLNNKTTLQYKEIAELSGFHPKYLLKLKKQILDGELHLIHGNKLRKPINTISLKEEEQIVSLFKRSNASIKKFAKFYGKRSYSCIYNVLKRHDLI